MSTRNIPALSCWTEVTPGRLQALFPIGGRILELHFDDGGSRHGRFQGFRRIESYQLSMIDDRDAIAEAVGFVHVMGGNEDRKLALGLDVGEHLPYGHA